MPTTLINLNSTTPPAPGGGLNVIFQNDSSNPINVSAYVDLSAVTTSPGGSDTQLQYNNASVFGGISTSAFVSGTLTFKPSSDSIIPLVLTSTTGTLAASLLDVNDDAVAATTPNLGIVMIRGKSIGGIGASGPTLLMLMPDSSPEGGTNGWVVGNANDTGNGFISAQVLNGSPSTPLITLSNGTNVLVLGVNDLGSGGSIDCNGGDLELNTNTANVVITNSGFILTRPTPTTSASQLGLGTTVGFGNGTPATPVTTTTKGTGSGPTTPQTVVSYLEIDLAGTKYWIPLVQ